MNRIAAARGPLRAAACSAIWAGKARACDGPVCAVTVRVMDKIMTPDIVVRRALWVLLILGWQGLLVWHGIVIQEGVRWYLSYGLNDKSQSYQVFALVLVVGDACLATSACVNRFAMCTSLRSNALVLLGVCVATFAVRPLVYGACVLAAVITDCF